jgi:hypothetical protein
MGYTLCPHSSAVYPIGFKEPMNYFMSLDVETWHHVIISRATMGQLCIHEMANRETNRDFKSRNSFHHGAISPSVYNAVKWKHMVK